jgi:ABC-type nitrate/sulfonate/bicarbonate transport system substrate-binding protein
MKLTRSEIRHGLFTLLVLAGSSIAAHADPATPEHVTLAIPAVNLAFIDTYLAEDEGFWKKQGLDVAVQTIQGIGSTNAVIAGSVDFAFASGPTVTRANAKGQKLVALATTIKESDQSILVRKEIAVRAHFDPKAPIAVRGKVLKGLTIATGGAGAIPDLVLKVVAQQAGLARDAVTTAGMAPTEFLAAFQRKSIDGFVSGPPFAQIVLLDGSALLVSDTTKGEPKEYSPIASALLLTRASFCPEHRSVCTKFVHGIAQASHFFHEHPDETVAVMKRHFGKFEDKVLKASYEALRPMMPDVPATTARELENADRLNIAAGFMTESEKLPDYQAVVDNDFLK